MVHAVERHLESEDVLFVSRGGAYRKNFEKLRMDCALAAIESEVAGAVFEIAIYLVAADAVGRREVVKIGVPADRFQLPGAKVADRAADRQHHSRENGRDYHIKDAEENQ